MESHKEEPPRKMRGTSEMLSLPSPSPRPSPLHGGVDVVIRKEEVLEVT